MRLVIDWNNPCLDDEQIASIALHDLDDFYANATPIDQLNLFFVLLNTCVQAQERGERVVEARLCYLMAYYLFVPLTPPGAQPLAQRCIDRAVELVPCPEYRDWQRIISEGN